MAKVIVSKQARDDLIDIHDYIYNVLENPDAAHRILGMLKRGIESLSKMPLRGKPLNVILTVNSEYRFLVCERYRIFYLFNNDKIEVVRILHSL